MRKTNRPGCVGDSSSTSPVWLIRFGMSSVDSGSVHSTTSRSPAASRVSALRVFSAGRGQRSPRRSRVVSDIGAMDCSGRAASRVTRRMGRQPIDFDYIAWRCLTGAPALPKRCRMAAQRISSLTPIAQVLARVEALARPVAPREARACRCGRPRARRGRDRQRGAARRAHRIAADGWAVRADQVADAGPYAPVLLAPPPHGSMPARRCRASTDAVLPPDAVMQRRREVHAARDRGRRRARGRRRCHAGHAAAPRGRAVARRRCRGAAGCRHCARAVREPRVRVVATPGCEAVALAISRARRGAWRDGDLRARARTRAGRRADRHRHHRRRDRRGARRCAASRCWRAWARSRSTASASRRARPRRSAARRDIRC